MADNGLLCVQCSIAEVVVVGVVCCSLSEAMGGVGEMGGGCGEEGEGGTSSGGRPMAPRRDETLTRSPGFT